MSGVAVVGRLFWWVWAGQLVSVIGSGAAGITLSLEIFDRTHSGTALAAITAAQFVGMIYCAPIAGALVDRLRRGTAIICLDVVLAVISATLAFAASSERTPIAVFVALVGLSGFCDSALSTSIMAAIRELSAEADLTRAAGISGILDTAPLLVSPALGAALYSAWHATPVFAVDAATFLFAGLLVLVCRWRGDLPTKAARSTFAGFKFILARPELVAIQVRYTLFNLFNGLGMTAVTVFVLGHAHQRSVALASFQTASAIGGVVGAALVAWLGSRFSRHLLIWASVVVSGISRIILALTPFVLVWSISGFLRSGTVQVNNAPLSAVWMEQVPREVQGTVFGARRLLGQGLVPPAIVIGGILAGHAGAPSHGFLHPATLLILFGACEVLIGSSLYANKRIASAVEKRELPEESTVSPSSAPTDS
ncbi:MFS transporter [Nocardia sp. CA2R105]|uniref:MFS transporter n=1 Tax=Nocardia coffeae TaxID=2873381 RepID=UPI001CA78965|nr:MFS transporter [Nocardia coffeae]MBY8856230.1 MFS transporter [Nocardia coffeae]